MRTPIWISKAAQTLLLKKNLEGPIASSKHRPHDTNLSPSKVCRNGWISCVQLEPARENNCPCQEHTLPKLLQLSQQPWSVPLTPHKRCLRHVWSMAELFPLSPLQWCQQGESLLALLPPLNNTCSPTTVEDWWRLSFFARYQEGSFSGSALSTTKMIDKDISVYIHISPCRYKAWNEPAVEVFRKQVLSFWPLLSSTQDRLKASPPREGVWSRAWVLASDSFLLLCFHCSFPCKLRTGETPALLSGLQQSRAAWACGRLQPLRAAAPNSFRHHPSRCRTRVLGVCTRKDRLNAQAQCSEPHKENRNHWKHGNSGDAKQKNFSELHLNTCLKSRGWKIKSIVKSPSCALEVTGEIMLVLSGSQFTWIFFFAIK